MEADPLCCLLKYVTGKESLLWFFTEYKIEPRRFVSDWNKIFWTPEITFCVNLNNILSYFLAWSSGWIVLGSRLPVAEQVFLPHSLVLVKHTMALWGYKVKLRLTYENSKHKLLRNGNEEVPRVKIQILFNYLKYLGSGYWTWIKSWAHATVIHSFGKAVSAASMGLASKQETKITKGKWKKCFVQGWNEGQHQMSIKKRALQHPMSAMLSPQSDKIDRW